jgi:hypothetical protein
MAAPNYVSSQQSYGPGIVVLNSLLGWNAGTPLDANTPLRVGLVQSVSFEVDLKLKPVYGVGVFPVGYGSGQGSVKGKLKMSSISGYALNYMMFGQTSAPGEGYQIIYNAPNAVPASTPWTVVIAAAKQDLGVFYAPGTTYPSGVFSQQLTQITGSPSAAGTYEFTASSGTYTFGTADASKAILITYATQPTTPWYEQYQFANLPQGQPPVFGVQFAPLFNGQSVRVTMPNCVASKISLPTKQGDWVEYEVDFEAFTVGEAGMIFTQDMIAL